MVLYLGLRKTRLHGEQSIKLFISYIKGNKETGRIYTVTTQVRFPEKGGSNIRMLRREITPLYIAGWLREAFSGLKDADLSFIIRENLDGFSRIAKGGDELHLICSNPELFTRLFSLFHADIENCGEKIRTCLE